MLSAEGTYIRTIGETSERMFKLPNNMGYINEHSAVALGWQLPDTLLE